MFTPQLHSTIETRRQVGLTRKCTHFEGRLKDGNKRVLSGLPLTADRRRHVHRVRCLVKQPMRIVQQWASKVNRISHLLPSPFTNLDLDLYFVGLTAAPAALTPDVDLDIFMSTFAPQTHERTHQRSIHTATNQTGTSFPASHSQA